MKRLVTLMAIVALASAANLWAGDPPGTPFSGQAVTKAAAEAAPSPSSGPAKSAADAYVESIDKIVGLTEDQKKAMTEIIEARGKAMIDWQVESAGKRREALNALREAQNAKDEEAIAKASKAVQEVYGVAHEIVKKSEADIRNLLTPEQKAKLRNHETMSMIKGMTAPAQLSDEQIKQIKAACKDSNPDEFGTKLQQAIQQVLTPEQKAAIEKMHRAQPGSSYGTPGSTVPAPSAGGTAKAPEEGKGGPK